MTYCNNVSELTAGTIFAPFLDVISSQSTTGPITFLALSAITKFIEYDIVSKNTIGLQPAICDLATAITHCRFEATDQAEDNAVLLKVLSLMEEVVCGIGSDQINDETVCDVIETCLSMACQMRRGDLLRRSAEMTIKKLSRAVFLRLSELEPEVLIDAKSVKKNDLQMSEPVGEDDPTSEELVHVADTLDEESGHLSHIVKPFERYGLASLREYFRVLISIIDPTNFHQYTDTTRIMALELINSAFESSGNHFAKHESFLNLTTNTLLKRIFSLIRSDNPALLQKALRVFNTIIQTTGEHLKLHQEVFLTYLLTCLSPMTEIVRVAGMDSIFYDGVPSIPRAGTDSSAYPSKVGTPVNSVTPNLHNGTPSFISSRSPDSREMMVEAIASLARIPSFFVNLFINYDCDVDRADLCVDLIDFLCRNAYPDATAWSTSTVQPLCLEAVLGYLISLAKRLPDTVDDKELVEKTMQNKARKRLVIEATKCFNENPSDGLKFLVKHNLIPDDSPASAVQFLRRSGRIRKKQLGEFLAKPRNKDYLDLFVKDFDFSNTSLDTAIRELFSAFRLPGESQQIERIIEKFAEHYVSGENNIKNVTDKDAAFVLSFAVIMLNTDLHNPQNKRQMSSEEFRRNLRGMNGKNDFPPEYLDNIYYTIKQREIIMPEEHDNEESFEHTWKEVQAKSLQAGLLKVCTSSAFDKDMFQSTWKPVVTMLSYVFATATEDAIFSRVITGFDHIAKIANYYQIPGVLDQISTSLCKISTLSVGDLSVPDSTIQIQIENDKVYVSNLSTQFGQDLKAQFAAVVMFRLAGADTKSLSNSWKDLVPAITNLYLYAMLSAQFSEKQRKFGLPCLPFVKPTHVVQRSKIGKEVVGLFSTLSSYLSGYNDSIPEPTEHEIDTTLCAVDCVNSCGVSGFLENVLKLSSPNSLIVVAAIEEVLPIYADDNSTSYNPFYPATLFLLELAALIAVESSDSQVSHVVVRLLYRYLTEYKGDNQNFLTRVLVYYLVTLRHASDDLLPELIEAITAINGIKHDILVPCTPALVVPLAALADEGVWSCDHVLKMEAFWSLLKIAASQRQSTGTVFSFVSDVIKSTNEITSTNLVSVLELLGEVASIGARGAQLEQDKAAIAVEFNKKYDHRTAIEMANEVIATMEVEVQNAIEALDLVQILETVVNAAGEDQTAADVTWIPYVRTLSQQCINPCRKIRQHAFDYYKRVVLSPVAHSRKDFDWVGVFAQSLFPLTDALLTAEVYDTDPLCMTHTRFSAAALLCRVFLQYVVRTRGENSDNPEMLDLWYKVLDTLKQLISPEQNTNPDAVLKEIVEESVKNMLLVMQSDDKTEGTIFGQQEKEFWNETWKRVDVLMPDLKQQLQPESVEEKVGKEPSPLPQSKNSNEFESHELEKEDLTESLLGEETLE